MAAHISSSSSGGKAATDDVGDMLACGDQAVGGALALYTAVGGSGPSHGSVAQEIRPSEHETHLRLFPADSTCPKAVLIFSIRRSTLFSSSFLSS